MSEIPGVSKKSSVTTRIDLEEFRIFVLMVLGILRNWSEIDYPAVQSVPLKSMSLKDTARISRIWHRRDSS